MSQKIMSIFTRTPISVGAGDSVGAIDSPVMRERHTRIPIIPGSAIKGVLKDAPNQDKDIFGKETESGSILFGEARVIAFPLRSAKGAFAWITCPLSLERLKMDDDNADFDVPEVAEKNGCIVTPNSSIKYNGDKVILEEYCLNCQSEPIDGKIIDCLKVLSSAAIWTKSMETRLVIVSDELFSFFVENACEIATRNSIDDDKGTAGDHALFSQEQVPSETLFYSVVRESRSGSLKKLSIPSFLQFGGDETVGIGFCFVELK